MTITSAIDGNNALVQNGGTTLSSSITFTFTVTASFNNLAAGLHRFTVVVVDTVGNKDPNPASEILDTESYIRSLYKSLKKEGVLLAVEIKKRYYMENYFG
jgi:hypothetical protein